MVVHVYMHIHVKVEVYTQYMYTGTLRGTCMHKSHYLQLSLELCLLVSLPVFLSLLLLLFSDPPSLLLVGRLLAAEGEQELTTAIIQCVDLCRFAWRQLISNMFESSNIIYYIIL